MFENTNGISPVNQDFIWLADYSDGTSVSEFNSITSEKNNFYMIDKSKLIRFGMIGQQMKLYFDIDTGMFYLNGLQVLLSYKTKDREYNLTGYGNGSYNDIITYKDAYTDANLFNPNGKFVSHIHQYNFGFKKKLVFDDGVEFAFQSIMSIPYNTKAFMEFKLVSNVDMDGELYIKRLGGIAESIKIPLVSDYAMICEWVIS